MIVALLYQRGDVSRTTLALHLAGEWARRGRRVTLVDADPQGSALDWSQQRNRDRAPRLFGVIGLARETPHREAPELAHDAGHIVIHGPPRVAGLLRSALLAADLVLIPAQPSPFDGWAPADVLALSEARLYRPQLAARFVLNRCGARTVIARETAETLADHDPPVLQATVGQRVVFAHAAQSGRLAGEMDDHPPRSAGDHSPGDRDRPPAHRHSRAMTARTAKNGFAARPGDPDRWIRSAAEPPRGAAAGFTAPLTIGVTPDLRGRIKVAAFQRGNTVADMLRDLLVREFPTRDGAAR